MMPWVPVVYHETPNAALSGGALTVSVWVTTAQDKPNPTDSVRIDALELWLGVLFTLLISRNTGEGYARTSPLHCEY